MVEKLLCDAIAAHVKAKRQLKIKRNDVVISHQCIRNISIEKTEDKNVELRNWCKISKKNRENHCATLLVMQRAKNSN